MSKWLPVVLVSALASASLHSATPTRSTDKLDKKDLIGIWAMLPLNNGTANVVEFKPDNQAVLHAFDCEKPQQKSAVETSHYQLDEVKKTIRLTAPEFTSDLHIIDLRPRTMKLEQPMGFDDISLTFSYIKVNKVVPLCHLYTSKEKPPQTAFKADDFIANPVIPDHPNVEKYLGKWQHKNVTQLEIVKNKRGQFILYQATDENWHYLFNDVHWQDNSLFFDSYAYSEKPDLFDHPFHKSLIPHQITLLANGKLSVIIDLDGDKERMEFTHAE